MPILLLRRTRKGFETLYGFNYKNNTLASGEKEILLPAFPSCTDSLYRQPICGCDGHRCLAVCGDELGDVYGQKLFEGTPLWR
jgi:hypothetical protein